MKSKKTEQTKKACFAQKTTQKRATKKKQPNIARTQLTRMTIVLPTPTTASTTLAKVPVPNTSTVSAAFANSKAQPYQFLLVGDSNCNKKCNIATRARAARPYPTCFGCWELEM